MSKSVLRHVASCATADWLATGHEITVLPPGRRSKAQPRRGKSRLMHPGEGLAIVRKLAYASYRR